VLVVRQCNTSEVKNNWEVEESVELSGDIGINGPAPTLLIDEGIIDGTASGRMERGCAWKVGLNTRHLIKGGYRTYLSVINIMLGDCEPHKSE
jgi:hypothetical protein